MIDKSLLIKAIKIIMKACDVKISDLSSTVQTNENYTTPQTRGVTFTKEEEQPLPSHSPSHYISPVAYDVPNQPTRTIVAQAPMHYANVPNMSVTTPDGQTVNPLQDVDFNVNEAFITDDDTECSFGDKR